MLTLCAVKLEAHGFSVLKAIGSAEADRLCAEHPAKIDLILIDVMLYPPEVQLDNHKNGSPRMRGDKLVPILRTKLATDADYAHVRELAMEIGGPRDGTSASTVSFLAEAVDGRPVARKGACDPGGHKACEAISKEPGGRSCHPQSAPTVISPHSDMNLMRQTMRGPRFSLGSPLCGLRCIR